MLMHTSFLLLLAGTALAVPAAQPAPRATPPAGCDPSSSCLTAALQCVVPTPSGAASTNPLTDITSCLTAACGASTDPLSILGCLGLPLPGL